RTLRTRVVEPTHRLEPDRGAGEPRGYLDSHRERGEERGATEALSLTHRQRRRQHGAARVRPRERLAFEGADEHTVDEGGPGDIRPPVVVGEGSLGGAAEGAGDGDDAPRPRLHRADEAGAERIKDGDLAVVDEPAGQ